MLPNLPQGLPQNNFGHPFVMYVRRGDEMVCVESAVYSRKTGERRLCWPIDAKEMVKRGGWSWEPVSIVDLAVESPEPIAAVAKAAEEPLTEPVAPAESTPPDRRRGPYRPRKVL